MKQTTTTSSRLKPGTANLRSQYVRLMSKINCDAEFLRSSKS
jgi:hypothetical protein